MASSLALAFRNAEEIADDYLLRSGSGQNIQMGMAASAGGFGTLGFMSRATDIAHHQEQYRHFQGYTYSLINTIANRIMGQRFRVGRIKRERLPEHRRFDKNLIPNWCKDQSERLLILDDHKLLRVMHKPNPIMTHGIMLYMTAASLEITGKGYWWMYNHPELGEQLWPLPASWVEPVHDEEKLYAYWKVTPSGTVEPSYVPTEDICYFYHPSPANPLEAMSPLQALARSVLASENIEEAQRRAFANGINPGLAVIVGQLPQTAGVVGSGDPPVLNKIQRDQLTQLIKRHYRGVINWDEPLILDGLIKDVKKITQNPRELDFLNSGAACQSRLAQGWGVSPATMGEFENANRASAAVADDSFADNVINPRLEIMSQIMTIFLAPRYDTRKDGSLIAFLEKAHSIDQELDLLKQEALFDRGCLMVNEFRSAHNLPRVKDGDVFRLPTGEEIDGILENPRDSLPIRSGRSIRKLPAKSGIVDKSGVWTKHWLAGQPHYESRLRNSLVGVLAEMKKSVEHGIRLQGANGRITLATLQSFLNPKHWAQKITDTIRGTVHEAVLFGAKGEYDLHNDEKGLPKKIENQSATLVSVLVLMSEWRSFVRGIASSIWTALKKVYRSGQLGAAAVGAAVRAILGPTAAVGSVATLARTESISAINGGQYIAQRYAGVTKRVWRTMRDARVRREHRQMEGVKAKISEDFDVGGFKCRYPGDPNLPAHLRCGCRCWCVSITK